MSVYKGQEKVLNSITAVNKEVMKEIVDSELKGTEITQTVINAYGTEILKYPVGRWYIVTINVASSFTDLPVQQAGIIEISTIDKVSTTNPWDNTYSSRIITYTTYNGAAYVYKLYSGGTAGVMMTDTGWQKVCTTKVADATRNTITNPSNVTSGTISYTISNGICFVEIMGITPDGTGSVTIPLPKSLCYTVGLLVNSSGAPVSSAFGGTNGTFSISGISGTTALYGSFSYPVAES